MGLFGGDSRTEANVYNTTHTTNNTRIRDLGFTGAHGVQALVQSLRLARYSIGESTQIVQSANTQASLTTRQVLAGLTNAGRDFSQRAIAASTGQATPLQTLAGAGDESGQRLIVLAGLVIAALALFK